MMVRFLADENLNNDVLKWAAQDNRILLSHDVATITKYAYQRIKAGQFMPGVIEISQSLPIGLVIDDIVLLAETSMENEWENQILYLPLR